MCLEPQTKELDTLKRYFPELCLENSTQPIPFNPEFLVCSLEWSIQMSEYLGLCKKTKRVEHLLYLIRRLIDRPSKVKALYEETAILEEEMHQ